MSEGEGREPRPGPLLAALVGLALLAILAPCADNLVDDAYITFRYGRNLAAGHGAVMNPGEWVEGSSSPLWVLVSALVHRVATGPVTVLWGLGLAAGLATLGVLGAAAERLGAGRRAGLVGGLLAAVHAGWLAWTGSGMETGLYGLAGTLLVVAVATAEGPGGAALAGIAGGVLAWTRPEGPGVALLVLFAGLAPGRLRRVAMGVTLGFVAGLLALRYGLYGELLPNTFHAKVPGGPSALRRGLGYLATALWQTGFGLVPLLALDGWRRGGASDPARRAAAAFVLGLAGLAVLFGGDHFPGDRFLVPAIPVLCLLAATSPLLAGERRDLLEVGLVVAMAAPGLATGLLDRLADLHAESRTYEALGRLLAREFPPGTFLAVDAAGAIPYYSGFRTLDMVGLLDRHLARSGWDPEVMPGHQRGDPDYVLGRRPDLVIPGPVRWPEGLEGDPRDRFAYTDLVPREWAFRSIRGMWKDPRFLAGWEARPLELAGERRYLAFVARR